MFRTLQNPTVSAARVADHVGGVVHGSADAVVSTVCSLADPKPAALAFCSNPEGMAGADLPNGMVVLIQRPVGETRDVTQIVVENPRLAFAVACAEFFELRPKPEISPGAVIHPTVEIGRDVAIGPGCVIGPGVRIGDGTEIRANVIVGPGVVIGRRCLIKSNAVVGEEGFGIVRDAAGRNIRIPQFGSAIIGDDVEIGSLTTVNSGTLDPVRIGDRVKIDDHVHIGHNAVIDEDAIITACAEMGRVRIGKRVWIGPNTSIKEGVAICDDAFVGIGSVVIRNLEVPGIYAGVPTRMLRANENKSPNEA